MQTTTTIMRYRLTPASQRALAYASGWTDRSGLRDESEAESLLVGLLREPECRAATMLARLAVDSGGGAPALA